MPPQQPANITTFDQKAQKILCCQFGFTANTLEEIDVQVKGKKRGFKGVLEVLQHPPVVACRSSFSTPLQPLTLHQQKKHNKYVMCRDGIK